MSDSLRSITVLAITLVGVTVVTLALASILVSRPPVSSERDEPVAGASRAPAASPTPGGHEPEPSDGTPRVGASLTVTGDREGTLRLTRESLEGAYALVGSDGRMTFEGQPVQVTQVAFDGWDFFPDEGECTVTPGPVDAQLGLGSADLTCTDIEDIRDNGTISLAGTVTLPADRLAPRELPLPGGTASVGSETWTFEQAYLATWNQPIISGQGEYNMELLDLDVGRLLFTYDEVTHRTSLAAVQRDGELLAIPDGACSLTREELGKPNPRDVTVELTFRCASVEVPGLGTVVIEGSAVVDELGFPF